MQQKECMIIRDLFPTYIEQLTNDTTNSIIEQHLQECSKCMDVYQEMLADYEEQRQIENGRDRRFWRRLRRYRYQLIGGFVGVVLTIALLIGGFHWLIWKINQTNYSEAYAETVEEYGEFEDYQGLSKLALFPTNEQIAENEGNILEYVYECSGLKLYQTCQIYLECTYTPEGYQQEVERLRNLKDSETGLATVFSEDGYEYPAVYGLKNVETCNEYALFLEEEQKIIYIYLQSVIDRRELYFDEKYLPYDYGQNGMVFEEVESYSMYSLEEWLNYPVVE